MVESSIEESNGKHKKATLSKNLKQMQTTKSKLDVARGVLQTNN